MTISYYSKSKAILSRWTTPPISAHENPIKYWQDRLLFTLLLVSLVFGLPVYIPSVALCIKEQLWSVAVADTLIYAWVIILFFRRTLPFFIRAFSMVYMGYALGMVLLLTVGPFGGGPVWLFAFPVLSAVFMGIRAALLAIAINSGSIIAIGVLLSYRILPWHDPIINAGEKWVVISLNFVFLNAIVAISVAYISRGLQLSLVQEKAMRESLEQKHRELVNFTRQLEREIVDRKRAEKETTHLRLYLKNMFDAMPSVLVGVDKKGLITQWNQEVERTTGLSSEDAAGRPINEVLPDFESRMGKIETAISRNEPQVGQKIPRKVNGDTRYSDIMVYPLISNGIEGAVIRIDDVTERVRMEQTMMQTEKMMSVGGLAAGMAHEINNPLGAILQGIQNAIRRISPDLEANRRVAHECGIELEAMGNYLEKRGILRYFEGMREAGSRAARIVTNMINFSRKSESKRVPVQINDLIDRVLELAGSDYDLKKQYDFRRIHIARDYGDGLPRVYCITTEIEQVLLNLLRNAAQAMAEMKETQVSRIIIRTRKEEGHMVIEIEDNGPGMDENARKRVFEPFFTTKAVGIGTGLGLSVSFFIVVNNHNGTLSVESGPGEGGRFIVRLPLERRRHSEPENKGASK